MASRRLHTEMVAHMTWFAPRCGIAVNPTERRPELNATMVCGLRVRSGRSRQVRVIETICQQPGAHAGETDTAFDRIRASFMSVAKMPCS